MAQNLSRAERLRGIREVYYAWERKYADQITPDPMYAHDGPSQYPETMPALSATPEMDAEYMRMIGPYLLNPPSK